MKYILLSFVFLFSTQALSNVGWFIAGALIASENKIEEKDAFYLQVQQIKSEIPRKNDPYSIREKFSFVAEPKDLKKLEMFFLNEGYDVTIERNDLLFNFKNQYEMYKIKAKKTQEKQIEASLVVDKVLSYLKWALWVAFSIIIIKCTLGSLIVLRDIVISLGPRSLLFKDYDPKGYLTKLYEEKYENKK